MYMRILSAARTTLHSVIWERKQFSIWMMNVSRLMTRIMSTGNHSPTDDSGQHDRGSRWPRRYYFFRSMGEEYGIRDVGCLCLSSLSLTKHLKFETWTNWYDNICKQDWIHYMARKSSSANMNSYLSSRKHHLPKEDQMRYQVSQELRN